jgi:competence protein ComEC
MNDLIIANLFFFLFLGFILGIGFAFYFNFWFLLNFLACLIFYLKFKNLKFSLLFLLFLFIGSFYYFLREEINLPQVQVPPLIKNYRLFLEDKIKSSLFFPEENLLRGIFLGSKFDDKEIKDNFVNSGLIHLTAVSGQNLTIMFSIFYEALKYLSFLTPNLIFYFSSFLIVFFVLLMGFEGNVLRAGIMGFLLILTKRKFGRIPLKRNILIFALLLFSLFSPKLIFKDIGTQLSFLAITGIFYLSPIFEKKLEFIKNNFFRKTISETLSAQIFTYPLILYSFGNFNFFSLISNLLVLPIVPYLMTISSLFLFFPVKYLAWFSFPLLSYILFVAKIFGNFVFYFKIPLTLVFLSYFLIFLEIYYQTKNETIDFHFNLS